MDVSVKFRIKSVLSNIVFSAIKRSVSSLEKSYIICPTGTICVRLQHLINAEYGMALSFYTVGEFNLTVHMVLKIPLT